MAATSQRETDQGPHYSSLRHPTDSEVRRHAALELYRGYLIADNGRSTLQKLGYTPSSVDFVADVVGYLGLQHRSTARGLEGRPSKDSSGTGSASLVEAAPGVAELTLTLPAKLEWQAREKMSPDESRALVGMGSLMRLAMIDTDMLIDFTDPEAANQDLVRALHASEQLPKFGLWKESALANLLRRSGQVATYRARYMDNPDVDFVVTWNQPGKSPSRELWRSLPDDPGGLRVYGRIPEFTP